MAHSHVFFDLDGTLTDPAPGIVASFQHAMTALEHDPWPVARLRGLIGAPLRECMGRIFETDDPDLIERAVRQYREHFAIQGMFDNRVYPGIPEALRTLGDQGFTLSVATSKPQLFADRIVDHFELRQYLARVHGSGLGGARSDKATLLEHALASHGLSGDARAQAVMVGDRQHDILGAKAHGMLCVGVIWGYGTLEELGRARPDRIVIDVDDLAQVVADLRRSGR